MNFYDKNFKIYFHILYKFQQKPPHTYIQTCLHSLANNSSQYAWSGTLLIFPGRLKTKLAASLYHYLPYIQCGNSTRNVLVLVVSVCSHVFMYLFAYVFTHVHCMRWLLMRPKTTTYYFCFCSCNCSKINKSKSSVKAKNNLALLNLEIDPCRPLRLVGIVTCRSALPTFFFLSHVRRVRRRCISSAIVFLIRKKNKISEGHIDSQIVKQFPIYSLGTILFIYLYKMKPP